MTRYELFLRETRTYEIIEDVKTSVQKLVFSSLTAITEMS